VINRKVATASLLGKSGTVFLFSTIFPRIYAGFEWCSILRGKIECLFSFSIWQSEMLVYKQIRLKVTHYFVRWFCPLKECGKEKHKNCRDSFHLNTLEAMLLMIAFIVRNRELLRIKNGQR
jgi:hypothetical protein